jgi:hypothetical protein
MGMSTWKVRPNPVRPERHMRQGRWNMRTKLGAFAVAVAIGLAGCSGSGGTPKEGSATTAANEPTAVNTADTGAVEVATSFVDAYGAFDVDEAITYLASDAVISRFLDPLRLNNSWFEASGYKQMLDSCEQQGSSASGTPVRCTFDWHGLRSDEIGLGPYSGWFDLTVRDGAIVQASLDLDTGDFSPQMWEPFAKWVSATHPKDAAVMYANHNLDDYRVTEKSIRLWEKRTREYVKVEIS